MDDSMPPGRHITMVGLSGTDTTEAAEPDLAAVASAIEEFGPGRHDQVVIELDVGAGEPIVVALFGGPDDRSVLYIEQPQGAAYLVNPSVDDRSWAEVSSGGQSTPVQARCVVPTNYAIRYLWHFLATGVLSPEATWCE